jgi:hypothetical protein
VRAEVVGRLAGAHAVPLGCFLSRLAGSSGREGGGLS